jgi:hypothetical protein
MDKQYGGAKLKADAIGSPGFTPVYDMIIHEDSKLSVLTAKSLKGFMLNLTVASNESKYLNLAGTKFTRPVTNFILKFVILRGTNDFTDLDDYNGVHKSFETKQSFFEEAKFQQNIWKRSIIEGRPAICPSVANLSMFDTINSARLMWFLTKKAKQESTASVFNFLFNNSKINGRGIGVLTMPAITQSTTLFNFLELPDGSDFFGIVITSNIRLYVISNVFAQIVRLFIEIGVIHFDLHLDNVMVYLTPKNKLKTLLIDFGRASNIMSDEPDGIYYKKENEESNDRYIAEKKEIRAKKEEFNNYFLKHPLHYPTGEHKHDYMQIVLAYIAGIEFGINNPLYFRDKKTYQMKWYERYKTNYPEVFVHAFNELDSMSRINVDRTGITPVTIQKYEQNGSFINLDNAEGIDAFIVPYPGPTRQVTPLVPRVFLPPPPVPRVFLPPPSIEPVQSSVDMESNISSMDDESLLSSVEDEPVQSTIDVESLPSHVEDEPVQSTIDLESLPSHVDSGPLLPPKPPVDKRSLAEINSSPDSLLRDNKRNRPYFGGRKNKLHKTNKRKNGKSKKNRRNKNTRKKRKN